jgi:DNA-binding transcriptional LysR family regulator
MMRLDNFDLNLLVAFEVLLEERSVTRAAKRLNVTQSAMSAALKRLRESFQDELLILHGKKMIPTQHALTLAPEVSTTLMRLKTLIATGTGFDPATSKRRFQINASDYITTVLLVPLIEHLQIEAPEIRLNLSLPNQDTYIEAILRKLAPDRRIDVAAQSFIQVPWLLRGTNRLAVMHERLARVTQPVFDLAIVDLPYDLSPMREMMQHHVSRTRDAGLTWLRQKILQFAKDS